MNFPVNPYLKLLSKKDQHLTLTDLKEYQTRLAFVMSIYSSAADVYAYQHASDDSLMHQTRLSQLQAARERMLFLIARVELVTKSPTMTDAFKASSFEQIIRERCAK